MVYEINVPVDPGHPMAWVTRDASGTRGRVQVHRDSQGCLFFVHTLWASRSVQRAYLRKYLQSGPPGACAPPEATSISARKGVWIVGPCTCNGRFGPCKDISYLLEEVRELLPGRSRLDSVEFDGMGSTAVVTYFEQHLPTQNGRSFSTRSLSDLPALTDRGATDIDPVEARTIREAVRLGYYDRPRRITMEELARVLGVTKSAVCRRLNKMETTAVLRLLDEIIGRAPETPNELTKSEGPETLSRRQRDRLVPLAH